MSALGVVSGFPERPKHLDAHMVAGTNNQAYNISLEEGMENELYRAVSSDVACQTAKPKALEVLMNLEEGKHAGNRKWLLNFDPAASN